MADDLLPTDIKERETLMYPALQAVLESKMTDNHLLFSFMYFLRQEDDCVMDVDVDLPIKDVFSPSLTEPSFSLAVVLFELHHAINIPDEFLDWNMSIREFLRRVATLPKLTPEEFGKHLSEMIRTFQLNSRLN
jgi:hypothetical protein